MRQSLTATFVSALIAMTFCGAGEALAQANGPPSTANPAISGRQAETPSCLDEIAKAEQRYQLPAGLLLSIALVESGRRDPANGLLTPWPWTINAEGVGHFYETPGDAAKGNCPAPC